MKRLTLVGVVLLMGWFVLVAMAQKDSIACDDDYFDALEKQFAYISLRLEWFTKTPSSIRSDYLAWQEKRLEWQEITPPDCAVEIHDDIIAMYANLGDISAIGLHLEIDPTSISGNRLVLEAIDRAELSITDVAAASGTISGNQVDIDGISDSLDHIADRFKFG